MPNSDKIAELCAGCAIAFVEIGPIKEKLSGIGYSPYQPGASWSIHSARLTVLTLSMSSEVITFIPSEST